MSETTDIVIREGTDLPSLIGDPEQQIEDATRAAKALKKVVDQAHLSRRIGQSDHLQFEAWQTVGHFYGITAMVESTHRDEDGTWHARAVTLRHGETIGAAESSCSPDEPTWKNKPAFQVESMAQTRAMGKALRSVLAFVVVLAGYNPTPAEEMGDKGVRKPSQPAVTHQIVLTQPNGEPTPECMCGDGPMHYREGVKEGKAWQGLWCPTGTDPIIWLHLKATVPERDIESDTVTRDGVTYE